MSIPEMSTRELLMHSALGDVRDLGPIVHITDPGASRVLPLDIPLITIANDTLPDADLSFGYDAGSNSGSYDEDLHERIVKMARTNPQSAVVLAQLLRATEHVSIEHALLSESLAYSLLQSGEEFRAWLSGQRQEQPPVLAAGSDDTVYVVHHAHTTELRLNRPESANALDQYTRSRLAQVFAALEHSREPIVLRGNGRHFCAGGDLREFGTFTTPVESHIARTCIGLPQAVARIAHRLRAHIHGSCIGAGIELSAFASQLVAHPATRIRLPEVAMGLLPGAGGTASIPRRIGRHRALQLMLDPAGIDAATALNWGLIDALEDNA